MEGAPSDLETTTVFAIDVNPNFLCGVWAFLTSVTLTVTIVAASK